MSNSRPFGVTILAILAAIAAVYAAVRTLQFLGIIPFFVTPLDIPVRSVSLFAALMYGILVWIYIWLVRMLWNVQPEAWLFLVVISTFYLIIDFITLVMGSTWGDVAVSVVVNALILIYCMLPGVKDAFGTDQVK
ncbi:MAG: hypothetical protein PVF74_01670 [Anaerolineales bacterium]|jgi:hypothetical protein